MRGRIKDRMRKVCLFGSLVVVVAAFVAFTASSAFALSFENSKWLLNGGQITSNQSASAEGEMLFENVLNGGAVLCSGLLEGTVGTEGKDEVTKVFNLSGTEIPELDAASSTGGISCVGVKTCETGSEVWPVGLPFKGQLKLDTETGLFVHAAGAGVAVLCLFLGGSIEELCVAAEGAAAEIANGATDVELLGSVEHKTTCNGNTEDGLVTVDAALGSTLTGTLSVSE